VDNHALPLVLLGGTLCNARLWQPVLARLPLSAVICPRLTADRSAEQAAQRLLEQLPPRFLLAGFSLGAIVALQMVADAPGRIAGLALLSVNPLAVPPEQAPARREAVSAARQQGLTRWLSSSLWPTYVAPSRVADQALRDLICRMAEESGVETLAAQTEIAITRQDNRGALASLACPIIIINGVQDPICTPHHHRLVAQSAPQARCVSLAAAGHFTLLEAPDEVAPPLRQWIQECTDAQE
jgi:pimeloyl-ACP methyl ester carboxylesterase